MVSIVCSRRAVRRQTLANRATLEVRAVSTGIFGVPYVVSESCTVYFLDHFSCENGGKGSAETMSAKTDASELESQFALERHGRPSVTIAHHMLHECTSSSIT